MVIQKTEHKNINSPKQEISSSGFFVQTNPSGGSVSMIVYNSSSTGTPFSNMVGSKTTGTVSKDYVIRKYIANSDLVSAHYRESIINFIKTVDNKDN